MRAGQSHITSVVVKKPAAAVYDFMADPSQLHRWSFGTWQTEIAADGLVRGTSLFDGSQISVRIAGDAALLRIDYYLGLDPQKLVPRIEVRVVPGEQLGLETDSCVLTFMAWRAEGMDDDRWRRLTASHEMEVMLIKSLLESGRA